MYSKMLYAIKCDIKWHYEWRCCVVDINLYTDCQQMTYPRENKKGEKHLLQ